MAELKILKLINGDEIIGYIDDGSYKDNNEDDEYSVRNLIFIKGSMRIVQEYDRVSRGHSIFLVDWMPSSKSNVLPIPKDKVITMASPQDSIQQHYLELQIGDMEAEEEDLLDKELQREANLQLLKKTQFDDDDMN